MVERSISFRERLVKSGFLNEEQVKNAIEEGRRTGKTLLRSIINKAFVSEDGLINFLEKEMEIPRVDLSSYLVDPKITRLVPYSLAKKYTVMPLFRVGDVLTVAMLDPFDIMALDEIRTQTKCDVEPMLSTSKEIEEAIHQYYGVSGTVEDLIKSVAPAKGEVAPLEAALPEEAPVARFINTLIVQAISEKASDIHIEPTENNVRIRYRVDGVMHDLSTAPLYILSSIVNRIKILGRMDIAESRVPQDGRFELKTEKTIIDVRVSTYPSIFGESVVLRLLDKGSIMFGLHELGFSDENLAKFEELIHRPYGIVLVTGPTGSGKTTTLYATLNHILTAEKNIMTIEDPVEYELPGIRQSQINPKAGLEFANALRSIMRQDPDVILVGEIRDMETARISIQAAMTGHLVFSTLHTNDAAGSLARLLDMGIEAYLIASSVAVSLAQRLVRLVCPRCREAYKPSGEILQKLGLDSKKSYQFYHAKGCKSCKDTGYKGRTGIFEILVVDDKIREMILRKASSGEIKQAAINAGMKTLREDGVQKIIEGKTSVEEVLRVTQLD